MIRYSYITASLREGMKADYRKMLDDIQAAYVCYKRSSNGIELEMQHIWDNPDIDFFMALSRRHPKVLIELSIKTLDESDFSKDINFLRQRFKAGEVETSEGEVTYEPFERILNAKERNEPPKPSVEELFQVTLNTLRSIRESGYVPCSSPSPSSGEKSIRDSIDRSLRYLESAIAMHKYLYRTR